MNTSDQFNSEWRKVASTIYKKPVDSKIFGMVEVDVTALENYISSLRKQGLKITLTHFFVLTIARAIKCEIPEFNVYVRRGKIVARPSIDAMVTVLQANGDMSSIKVPQADTHTYASLEEFLNAEIVKTRKGAEEGVGQKKNIIAKLPWPTNTWFFSFYKKMIIDWGYSLPFLGLSPNSFGSFAVTNIGSLGLDSGFPALLPSSNLSFVFVMGGIQKKPVVVNDEIVIRRMMSLSIVMDHRISDASHGSKLFRYIKHQIKHPEELF
jgi:pyruvate dehydrogenase E2 component (dihydrolipoamide acetyltransferase)